jgi:hypothetical protein
MTIATPILYGIPNCDTVKRARAWLTDHGVAHAFHDFKKAGVPAARLEVWLASAGWERVLNRQGTTWRKLDDATKANVSDAASARVDAGAGQRHQAPGGGVAGRRHHRGLRRRRLGAPRRPPVSRAPGRG